jgi:hypothetical protein
VFQGRASCVTYSFAPLCFLSISIHRRNEGPIGGVAPFSMLNPREGESCERVAPSLLIAFCPAPNQSERKLLSLITRLSLQTARPNKNLLRMRMHNNNNISAGSPNQPTLFPAPQKVSEARLYIRIFVSFCIHTYVRLRAHGEGIFRASVSLLSHSIPRSIFSQSVRANVTSLRRYFMRPFAKKCPHAEMAPGYENSSPARSTGARFCAIKFASDFKAFFGQIAMTE